MKVGILDAGRADAPEAVAASLKESGFAVLERHPVAPDMLNRLYPAWDAFFRSDETAGYLTDAESQAGYFPPGLAETAKGHQYQDLKEYFQYWPGGSLPPAVRALTLAYHEQMFRLGGTILSWLQANTPGAWWRRLDRPLATCLSREQTLLRVLRYPPLTGDEPAGALRAAAHEDINLITLLPAASESGLEIRPQGMDWIPVAAPAGAIIINAGDMLQELTDGALPSTTHRVVNPTGAAAPRARLTAPLFCHPDADMTLSERYTAGAYLRERLTEINQEKLRPA